jgi:imidazolonepropionase-like amidohydrolase
MRKILFNLILISSLAVNAQENMHPAAAQRTPVLIKNGTLHLGNGQVIENGYIFFDKGKIISVGGGSYAVSPATSILDAGGKQLYPGLIAASTNLGLIEVSAVRSTADYAELGMMNPNIHSLVAYNTDSKVINTVRSNGILLAHIVPSGGLLSGTSSVVQLDAWNWEDAAYKTDNGIHLNIPVLLNRPGQSDQVKSGLERLDEVRNFFREAKAYTNEPVHAKINLKFEAVKGLFSATQTLFVHCDLVREMMVAIDFAREFGFKLVLVGASDSYMIPEVLKENNVAVILSQPHSLPSSEDDDIDQPYKTGAVLQKAGVLFTICQDQSFGYWRQRDLPFQAGTMAAYGLSREEALSTLTLNAAKILGIDQLTGTLEVGKDANIVLSEGDLLDMKSSKVTKAFIQGREINLDNKQTQLFEKYKTKYSIK